MCHLPRPIQPHSYADTYGARRHICKHTNSKKASRIYLICVLSTGETAHVSTFVFLLFSRQNPMQSHQKDTQHDWDTQHGTRRKRPRTESSPTTILANRHKRETQRGETVVVRGNGQQLGLCSGYLSLALLPVLSFCLCLLPYAYFFCVTRSIVIGLPHRCPCIMLCRRAKLFCLEGQTKHVCLVVWRKVFWTSPQKEFLSNKAQGWRFVGGFCFP